MLALSSVVTVMDGYRGTTIIVRDHRYPVIPQSCGDLLVWEPPQYQTVTCDLKHQRKWRHIVRDTAFHRQNTIIVTPINKLDYTLATAAYYIDLLR